MSVKTDAERFIRLAAPYEQRIYGTCFSILHSREDAEDALQETMLKAFRSWGSYRGEAQIQTWLTRIAVNVCIDLIRKRKDSVSLDGMETAGFDPPDPKEGPYEKLEQSERLRLLKEAIGALDPDARAMITLRDVKGCSYEEISEILEQPLGTVKSRLNRAREKLRDRLLGHEELFGKRTVRTGERRGRA